MNQQLLNINTLITANKPNPIYPITDASGLVRNLGVGIGVGLAEAEKNEQASLMETPKIGLDLGMDFNNPIRLEKITSIVNNSNASNTSNKTDTTNPEQIRYKIIRYLGRGIHGNLYLAVDSSNNRVICKEIQLDADPSNNAMQTQQLEFELGILKYLSNNMVAKEHINPCLDYKIHNNHVYTIFPVFKGYSLAHFQKYMSKISKQEDYYKILFYLIKSLLHALAKIHETGIAHQNITPNSILVSTFNAPYEIKVKLTDFGLGCGRSSIGKDVFNCRKFGHAPVKFTPHILEQLTDTDFLKVSQKYDILCLGLILVKFLLYFDRDIGNILGDGNPSKIDNARLQYIRDIIKRRYLESDHKIDTPLQGLSEQRLLLEYLRIIWKYMLSSTVSRKPAQYITDKIIIYEKYKNDIF
jgi:serine/threonine protein kinase